MKRVFLLTAVMQISAYAIFAQTQAPGQDILGFGYDVFGNFADNTSMKTQQVFKYGGNKVVPIGSNSYNVPENMILQNIGKKEKTIVSGSSMRDYAKSFGASIGVEVDALTFSGSVSSTFNHSWGGSEQEFFTTIRDASRIWRVSIDKSLDFKTILNPKAQTAINNLAAEELFRLYGTHVIVSAYLGGRADYTMVTKTSSDYSSSDISGAVSGKYGMVSANASANFSTKQKAAISNSKTSLTVTGGNAEYANDISNYDAYSRWADGIRTLPVLCDFEKGSLLPIWELASTTTRKNELITEFAKLCKLHPLPEAMAASMSVSNQAYFMKSLADETLYIDISGYNLDAQQENGSKVSMYPKDNIEAGLQGADRFIKIIPHATEHDYVFLQPQHSNLVFDVDGGKTNIALYPMGNNNFNQMFKLTEVDGLSNTYYIENKRNGNVLTFNGKSAQLTVSPNTKAKNQQWVLEPASASQMAPPNQGKYRIKNFAGGKYFGVPGTGASNAMGVDVGIIVENLDESGDHDINLSKVANNSPLFYMQPLHDNHFCEIERRSTAENAKLIIHNKNNFTSQQFQFEYAGEPRTYRIKNIGSNQYLQIANNAIHVNISPVIQANDNNGQNSMWVLEPGGVVWYAPESPTKVKIKVAYSDKYFDLQGGPEKAKQAGSMLAIFRNSNDADRYFTMKKSGLHSNIWLEMEAGMRLDIKGGVANNDVAIHTAPANTGRTQMFAIYPIAKTKCLIFSQNGKALTVRYGKINEDINIVLFDINYQPGQVFELIDANTNKPIEFPGF